MRSYFADFTGKNPPTARGARSDRRPVSLPVAGRREHIVARPLAGRLWPRFFALRHARHVRPLVQSRLVGLSVLCGSALSRQP